MFNDCDDLVLRELGTEQVRQILCASVAVRTYWLNDERIVYAFLYLFRDKQYTVAYVNGGRYLQRVLQTFQIRLGSLKGFDVPSTSEVLLLFHAFSFV